MRQGGLRKSLFSHITIFFLLQISALSVLATEADTTSFYEKNSADQLYRAALSEQLLGRYGRALRLLQMGYALSPSAEIAVTIGQALPQGYETMQAFWLKKAFDLSPSNGEYAKLLFAHYVSKGQTSSAIEVLNKHITLNSENYEALILLASAYAEQKEFDKAIKILDSFPAEGPSEVQNYQKEQLLLQILASSGRTDIAKKVISANVSLEETDPQKVLSVARKLLSVGAYDDALDLIKKSKARRTPDADMLVFEAVLYLNKGDRKGAIASLKELISLNALSTEEKTERVVSIISLDQTDKNSLAEYLPIVQDLARTNPSSYDAQELLLSVLYSVSQEQAYNDQLKLMVARFPEKDKLYEALIGLYVTEGQLEQACRVGEEGLRRCPQKLRIYLVLGGVAQLQGDEEKALALWQKALTLPIVKENAEDATLRASILASMGDLYYERRNVDKAFDLYENALRYNQNDAMILNNYAYYLGLEGKKLKQALSMVQKANEIAEDNPTILDTYAYLLMLNKDYVMAEIYIRRAIEHADPPKAALFRRYADILEVQGKKNEAIIQREKADRLEQTNGK